MGMGPAFSQGVAAANQQRQQGYQDSFNNSAYAPIPGFTGQANQQGLLGNAAPQSQAPWQSQWNELNGRLIGNTYLPPDTTTVDVGKGWYEVHNGGQRVGTLRPGGRNGVFINDTGAQMPQPALVGGPPVATQPGTAMPIPPQQGFNAAGPYGRQAMQMAGLLGQPSEGYPGGGGLLGGPKGGYRPGGK